MPVATRSKVEAQHRAQGGTQENAQAVENAQPDSTEGGSTVASDHADDADKVASADEAENQETENDGNEEDEEDEDPAAVEDPENVV